MFFNFVTIISSCYFIFLMIELILLIQSDSNRVAYFSLKRKRIKSTKVVIPTSRLSITTTQIQQMRSTFTKLSLLAFLSFFSQFCKVQANAVQTVGLYVNDFKHIIGDVEKENELLRFAKEQGFNYLALYNLGYIHKNLFDLTKRKDAAPLANFIERAKTAYGIRQVGGIGETYSSFDKMIRYNTQHAKNKLQQLDVLNIEFEFWNANAIEQHYCKDYLEDAGLECSVEGAFEFYLEQLAQLQHLCQKYQLTSETYIGNTTASQNTAIGKLCDRVLVHYYRTSDTYNNGNSIYNYKVERLKELAPETGTLEVLPIFSARENHMGPWLLEHSYTTAYQTFMEGLNGFEQDSGAWKAHIKIGGYQWYRYTEIKSYIDQAAASEQSSLNPYKDKYSLENDYQMAEMSPTFGHTGFTNYIYTQPLNASYKKAIYPNPAYDVLHIKSDAAKSFRLVNSNGIEVIRRTTIVSEKEIDLSNISPGIYSLQLELADGFETRKIVVQR